MKLKLLLIVLAALTLTLFSGCAAKEVVYVDKPYEVKVPVKCVVALPDGEINQSLNDSEKLVEVLKYISKLHKNIEVCI